MALGIPLLVLAWSFSWSAAAAGEGERVLGPDYLPLKAHLQIRTRYELNRTTAGELYKQGLPDGGAKMDLSGLEPKYVQKVPCAETELEVGRGQFHEVYTGTAKKVGSQHALCCVNRTRPWASASYRGLKPLQTVYECNYVKKGRVHRSHIRPGEMGGGGSTRATALNDQLWLGRRWACASRTMCEVTALLPRLQIGPVSFADVVVVESSSSSMIHRRWYARGVGPVMLLSFSEKHTFANLTVYSHAPLPAKP